MSARAGGDGLAPANGMAGAGLACGIFGVLLAAVLGFASVPFAVVAVITGIFAMVFSAKGKTYARAVRRPSRISQAGTISGGLAIVLGLLGVLLR